MRYLSLLLVFSIQVVSQNEDGGRSSALHEVLQREKQLSNQLDQAKVRCSQSLSQPKFIPRACWVIVLTFATHSCCMPRVQALLESLVGRVGASEASRIQDYLGEHLASTGTARTPSGAAPSPPGAGCVSRSVPTGPSCWDESTFGLVLVFFSLFISPPFPFSRYILLYCSPPFCLHGTKRDSYTNAPLLLG